jgi:hypothetical protein
MDLEDSLCSQETHWTLTWAIWILSTASCIIYLRLILILSSFYTISKVVPSIQDFWQILYEFSFLLWILYGAHTSSFEHPNILGRVKIMKFLIL